MKQCALVILNVRSAHNVGSMFRTADAAGVKKIYLVGYTPRPIDRFGKVNKEIQKTALGADTYIPWQHVATWSQCRTLLKKEGYSLVAIEQHKKSIPFNRFRPKVPIALIVGNEVRGLSPQVLRDAHHILEIPMRGKKESLNVSVSLGIVLFSL